MKMSKVSKRFVTLIALMACIIAIPLVGMVAQNSRIPDVRANPAFWTDTDVRAASWVGLGQGTVSDPFRIYTP